MLKSNFVMKPSSRTIDQEGRITIATVRRLNRLATKPFAACGLVLLLGLLLGFRLAASTLYVDYAGGSDSNSGLAQGAAWQHSPGDGNATANAGSWSLQPGDTIRFKGGVVYAGQIRGAVAGTPGYPITYESGHLSGWGTAPAVIDGTSVPSSLFSTTYRGLLNLPSYSRAVSLVVTNPGFAHSVSACIYLYGHDIIISNCGTGGGGANGGNGFMIYAGTGANAYGSNYVFVGCTAISNAWHGYFVAGRLINCVFTNCYAAWNGCQPGTYANGWFIGDNRFGIPSDIVLSQCSAANHPNKGAINLEPANNVVVERFIATGTNAFGIAVTNDQYRNADATNLWFINCLVDVSCSANGGPMRINAGNTIYPNGISSVYLLNNTFRSRHGSDNCGVIWIKSTYANACFVNGVFGTNNIVIVGSNNVPLVQVTRAACSNIFFDYTLYWTNTSPRPGMAFIFSGTNCTWTQWRAFQDAHSQLADPDLDSNLAPRSGSPVRGAGADLSAYFTNDVLGHSRQVWDVGAYVYKLTPPTRLRILK